MAFFHVQGFSCLPGHLVKHKCVSITMESLPDKSKCEWGWGWTVVPIPNIWCIYCDLICVPHANNCSIPQKYTLCLDTVMTTTESLL